MKNHMRRDIAAADVEAMASKASRIMLEENIGYPMVLNMSH